MRAFSIRDAVYVKDEMELQDMGVLCPICLSVFVDPVDVSCCRQSFCKECFASMRGGICAMCRNPSGKCMPSSRFLEGFIGKLKVYCPHCNEAVLRSSILSHISHVHDGNAVAPSSQLRCVGMPHCDFRCSSDEERVVHQAKCTLAIVVPLALKCERLEEEVRKLQLVIRETNNRNGYTMVADNWGGTVFALPLAGTPYALMATQAFAGVCVCVCV